MTFDAVHIADDEAVRAALLAERTELLSTSEGEAASRRPVELDQQSVGRLSRMDAMQGQAMAKAVEERRRIRILKIDAALKRLDDGSFGECLRCGEEITAGRLASDLAATLCVDCAR